MLCRWGTWGVLAGLSLALVIVAAACGGGGGGGALSLEKYFQRLEELDQAFDEKNDALSVQLQNELAAVASPEEAIEVLARLFRDEGLPTLQGFVDDLAALDPPSEAEDAHNEAVEAGREAVQALEDLIEQIESADTPAEVERLLTDDTTDPAFERFDQACFGLQEVADDNDIAIDLNCES
jgi:hypothetical protein